MSIDFYKALFRTWNIPGRLVFLSCLLSFSGTIYADVFTVNVTTDGNAPNQLRGAIAAAMAAGPGPHIINISAGTYDISMGEISFGGTSVTISIIGAGPNLTILNMNSSHLDRFFLVNPTGNTPNVNISVYGVQFNGGHLTSDNFDGGAVLCGGPFNNMIFRNCNFSNNTIDASKGLRGGALAMNGGGSLIIDSCNFINNSCPTGNGGAFSYFLPNTASGSLSITNSNFDFNSTTGVGGSGGAIAIFVQGATSTTSNISIHGNSFTNNMAKGSGGAGGAIFISNLFGTGNTPIIHFNRFANNAASTPGTSAIGANVSVSNVDINNNWWGCNESPVSGSGCNKAAVTTSGTGSLIINNWLQLTASPGNLVICGGNLGNTDLITAGFQKNSAGNSISPDSLAAFSGVNIAYSSTAGNFSNGLPLQSNGTATILFTSNGATGTATVNAIVDNVLPNDPVSKTTFAVNPAPTINFQPSSTSACPGNPVSFTVSASGSNLSFNWFKDLALLSDGTNVSGSTYNGSNTSTFNIFNPSSSDNSTAYKVVVTGNGCSMGSNNVQLVIAPLVIPNSSSSSRENISITDNAINDSSCNRIAFIQPSGSSPINGSTTASVTIDAGQPSFNGQPYVKRHYDIVPAANANTATATVTLYFLQSEFDSYNAAKAGTDNDLPTGPTDAQGKSNLRVTQYHGTGTAPGNYTGWTGAGQATVLIDPGSSNVIWNSSKNWWEVSFPVTGFSGFFVTGLVPSALPVTLQSITALQRNDGVLIQWRVTNELNFSHYEIETSSDGRNFATIGKESASNSTAYSFLQTNPADGINFYRLKMIDIDGSFSFSAIISCNFVMNDNTIMLLQNPFKETIQLSISSGVDAVAQLYLTDDAGRLVLQKRISLNKGRNVYSVQVPANLANGVYFLKFNGQNIVKTFAVLKSE